MAGNAGPDSVHHRCPASASTDWYGCRAEIAAAGESQGSATCPYGCELDLDCIEGIASTADWYLDHGQQCDDAWRLAVHDNAGPDSVHGRCPSSAASAWSACKADVVAAAKRDGHEICTPGEVPCSSVSFQGGAAWDFSVWLRALAEGTDGALRWSLSELGFALNYRATTWGGDDADPKNHDKYVSGNTRGFYWYDGSPIGRAKPIAWLTAFLADYLREVGQAAFASPSPFSLRFSDAEVPVLRDGSSNAIGATWLFDGPNCFFAAAPALKNEGGALEFRVADAVGDDTTVVLLSWSGASPALRLLSSADATVSLSPAAAPIGAKWDIATAAISGFHGGESRSDGVITIQALAGEVISVQPSEEYSFV